MPFGGIVRAIHFTIGGASMRFMLWFLMMTCLIALPVSAQTGKLVIEDTTFTFEPIREGDQAEHIFSLRNEGNAPLRITEVRPACGCTTPEWTRKPVAPGETGSIKATFDSKGRPGPFRKSILVLTDGEPEQLTLYIQGQVRPAALTHGVMQGNLQIEMEVVDLGEVTAETNAVKSLMMQNKGERPIRITEARSSDERLKIEYPRKPIFRDDLVDLNLVVVTEGMTASESFDYSLTLVTDDADQPLKTISIRGKLANASPLP